MPSLRVLALEPYYGGSHRAFLDRWSGASRHGFTILGLPPYKWKWRMRHGAITLAGEVARRWEAGERWDVVFATDMLDLATFRGLAPPASSALPTVAYFHENQLTYPVREERERDLHFAFTNLTTALAADAVWFNSTFHHDTLLAAFKAMINRMPDHRPIDALARIERRSDIRPQGIEPIPPRRGPRPPGPLRILWVARWEHDKDPETFFAALERLVTRGTDFRLSVLGERYRRVPPIFAEAEQRFARNIDHWGWQEHRADYLAVLRSADVVVSTARHEFFGVAIVEALAAGCYPLLPNRLAYPEILAPIPAEQRRHFFYDDLDDEPAAEQLAHRLTALAKKLGAGQLWPTDPTWPSASMGRSRWWQTSV